MSDFIPYGRHEINDDDIKAVTEVLMSDFLTQGPKVAEFESAFAEYVGVKHAIAVSNGTAALHLGALALGVNERSNVITTPITFAASANGVRYAGGKIHFVDIDPDTFVIDLDKVEALISSKPKGFFCGIVPVDLAGYPVDLERLADIAMRHGLWIMEDACHAPGSYFIDSRGGAQNCGNGNFADLSVFSFHPVKHISTGEGGMVTTNDEALDAHVRRLRTHGIARNQFELNVPNSGMQGEWYYEMQELGFNYRITDFQCALGISQLKRAHNGVLRRNEIAKRYVKAFESSPLKVQHACPGRNAYHLFIIQTATRKALYDHLRRNSIQAQVHYIPVHYMPYYQRLGWKPGDFPIAEKYYEQCLSIPMYPSLSDEQQEFVIEKVLEFVSR